MQRRNRKVTKDHGKEGKNFKRNRSENEEGTQHEEEHV